MVTDPPYIDYTTQPECAVSDDEECKTVEDVHTDLNAGPTFEETEVNPMTKPRSDDINVATENAGQALTSKDSPTAKTKSTHKQDVSKPSFLAKTTTSENVRNSQQRIPVHGKESGPELEAEPHASGYTSTRDSHAKTSASLEPILTSSRTAPVDPSTSGEQNLNQCINEGCSNAMVLLSCLGVQNNVQCCLPLLHVQHGGLKVCPMKGTFDRSLL